MRYRLLSFISVDVRDRLYCYIGMNNGQMGWALVCIGVDGIQMEYTTLFYQH